METVLGLLAVLVLVLINGFFVAAEFSLVGARRTRIAQLASEGNRGAQAAHNAIQHLDSYIAATQLGITLASLGLGWIGEPAIAHVFEPIFHAILPEEAALTVGHTISVIIAFALVTMLHIVFGELAPKSIALQRPESTSMVVARPTTWFLILFRPVIYVMNAIGNAVVRLIGFDPAGGHGNVHSVEELEMLVKSSGEAGILNITEERILRKAFDFSEITAEEVMKPRVEVDAIAIDMSIQELLPMIAEHHHSRYPVYAETVDEVVGVLHTKDLLDLLIRQPELLSNPDAKFDIHPLLRAPIFVPESLSVDQLLEKMQKTKTHLAVVMDEYGGTAGVVTMEDILEELVGEVQDEFDVETSPITAQGDIAIVDGLVSLSEVVERFGDPGGEWESTTIGGYIGERLGRIPAKGDKVPFGPYELCVDVMDGRRVAKVRFHKPVVPDDETAQKPVG